MRAPAQAVQDTAAGAGHPGEVPRQHQAGIPAEGGHERQRQPVARFSSRGEQPGGHQFGRREEVCQRFCCRRREGLAGHFAFKMVKVQQLGGRGVYKKQDEQGAAEIFHDPKLRHLFRAEQGQMGSIPFFMTGPTRYRLLDRLLVRAPYYGFAGYDPQRLEQVLSDPAFRQALLLASPGFYGLLEKKDFAWAGLSDKERHSLLKYYNRMCFRPTPFGSFASFTLLDSKGPAAGPERLHRLEDQEQRLAKDGTGQPLSLNPLLYRLGKEWRFMRTLEGEKGAYRFALAAIAAEPFYDRLFARLRGGPLDAAALISWVMNALACDRAAAAAYLEFLLDQQALYVPATGSLIGAEDGAAPAPSAPVYAALERPGLVMAGCPGEAADLVVALRALEKLYVPPPGDGLAAFISAFSERFDLQKVPLLLALDPDAGIPYELPEGAGEAAPAASGAWTAVHRLLLRRWPADDCGHLQLRQQDLDALEPAAGALPNTLSLLYRRAGDGLVIDHAGGATGTSLPGRFSVFSGGVTGLCRELAGLEAAANPGVVFADIGQLSAPHTDNINRRARIYPYEIPLNVCSPLPRQMQLPPSDLLLSVRGGELLLESRGLGCRVIPRLSTAYNFRHNPLGVFRLLCAVPVHRPSLSSSPPRPAGCQNSP
jgi:hypothetical protein